MSNEEKTITKTVVNRRIRSLSRNIALRYGVTVETKEGEGESIDFVVMSPTSNDEVILITVIDPNQEIWDIVKRTEADFDGSIVTFPFKMIQVDETNQLGLAEELQAPEIKTPAEEFKEVQKEVQEVVSETKPKIQHQPRPRVRPIVHRKN